MHRHRSHVVARTRLDRASGSGPTGVVDENVYFAELGDSSVRDTLGRIEVGEIGTETFVGERRDFAQLGEHFRKPVFVATDNRDPCAGARELMRCGATDALRCATNDGCPTFK